MRSIRYGEADRILHLYSKSRGRIGAIAKGARKPRSRFGGRLEPGQALESWMGNLSELRLDPAYRQPLVTWNENLLIKEEALFQTGNTGAALDTLNAERAAWGEATEWHSALSLSPVSAPVTLADIMTEKYLVLFQNIEYWNDYKRTCLPALTPAAGKANIPGRLLYGTTERQTNPNVPDDPARNWNDPQPCSAE